MRLLLICIVGWWASAALGADALSECAAIEQAMERLRCYDRIARGDVGEGEVGEGRKASTLPDGEPEAAAQEASPRSAGEPEVENTGGWFGRDREPSAGEQLDHVTASIVSVRKGPLGRQIISLSNGQVWMENEPGRRRIEPDQSITIRRHRWHYELELADQPNVAVRRID